MTHMTAEQPGTAPPPDLLMKLRNVTPKRPLLHSEALTVAKLQALRARQLLGELSPRADLGWVLHLPNTTVRVLPAHELRTLAGAEASGFTKRLGNGDYFIAVNKNASHTHRRFTLAHEVKHLLDYPYHHVLYDTLGYGDTERRDKQVERICDHFAAHFLVPAHLLKKAWATGFQAVDVLAGMFSVSEETMQIRLRNEGFTDTDPHPTHTYFRRVGLIQELGMSSCGNAA
jgi:IrrE N-terminal-like domain